MKDAPTVRYVQNSEPRLCQVEGAPIGDLMLELQYRGRLHAVDAVIWSGTRRNRPDSVNASLTPTFRQFN